MKKSNKRILAKEIIIFFSAVAIVGLVCLVFLSIDRLTVHKSQKLRVELSQLTISSDSIVSLFPKAISFEEMIIGELPKEYKIIQSWDDYIVSIDSSKIVEMQLNKLYNLLKASKYNFKPVDSGWIPPEVFFKNIRDELNDKEWKNKTELKRIYKFLIDRNYIKVSFEQFVFNLEGYPLPPDDKLYTKYTNSKKEIEATNRNIKIINAKILKGDDIENLTLSTFLILIIIIYPLRFIVLSIIWAIKTLKE